MYLTKKSKLHKKTEWVTRTLKKKGKCVACWREFAPGDTVVTPIRDDVLHTNATYCPRGLEHIDNMTDYRNYLREHKKITDVVEVEMLATKWLIHRTKKGYESIVDIKIITKENKETLKTGITTTTANSTVGITTTTFTESQNFIQLPDHVLGVERVLKMDASTISSGCLLYTSPSPRDS